jgi:hypothetical protein
MFEFHEKIHGNIFIDLITLFTDETTEDTNAKHINISIDIRDLLVGIYVFRRNYECRVSMSSRRFYAILVSITVYYA